VGVCVYLGGDVIVACSSHVGREPAQRVRYGPLRFHCMHKCAT